MRQLSCNFRFYLNIWSIRTQIQFMKFLVGRESLNEKISEANAIVAKATRMKTIEAKAN